MFYFLLLNMIFFTSLFICLKQNKRVNFSYSTHTILIQSIRSTFINLNKKNLYMFELLCIISMALCKVLVLVNVGIVSFFPFCTELTEGGLSSHVSRQIFLVLYRHCLRTHTQKKKRKEEEEAQKLSQLRGGLLSEVFSFQKVFQPKVDKAAAVAGSSRGHISAARTDPNTP